MEIEHTMQLAAFVLNEYRAHEDPWHELATGGLTADQVTEIRRHMESEDQVERKLGLFGPTTKEVSEQRLHMLLTRFYSASPSAAASQPSVHDLGRVSEASQRRRWNTTALVGAVSLAAAVVLLWFIGLTRPPDMEVMTAFELSLEDGWSTPMRGVGDPAEPSSCDRYYPRGHASMKVRLRPSHALDEELSVAAFAQPGEGKGEGRWLVELSFTQTDKGVITIALPLAELDLNVGPSTVTFYVVREHQPIDASELRALPPGAHPGAFVARTTPCLAD